MAVLHRIVGTAVLGAGLLLPTAGAAGGAAAGTAAAQEGRASHGALTSPASRAAICGGESTLRAGAACAAAVEVSGPAMAEQWDDLRVADVAGRDREKIPDGKLCSGGLDRFSGLDLARADWPATELAPGADYTFRYRGTIPHQGTFRIYVTTDAYDPAEPLAWAHLERKPFLEVTDPPLANGSYTMKGRLPTGKTGRHLIYTIWQNSDTPDTYYSCSDVVFGETADTGRAATAEPTTESTTEPTAVAAEATADDAPTDGGDTPAGGAAPAAAGAPAVQDGGLTWIFGAAALLVLATTAVIVALLRRR